MLDIVLGVWNPTQMYEEVQRREGNDFMIDKKSSALADLDFYELGGGGFSRALHFCHLLVVRPAFIKLYLDFKANTHTGWADFFTSAFIAKGNIPTDS